MHASRPIILISGYTAAGKTTHAQLLAAHLGYEYLGASRIRRALLGSTGGRNAQEWDPSVDLRRRRSFQSDRVLDRIIDQKIENSQSPLVVDAWLQPWLCSAKEAIRVWIESSAESRTMKAIVTHLRNNSSIPEDIASQVLRKDEFSHWIFSRLYKIRILYARASRWIALLAALGLAGAGLYAWLAEPGDRLVAVGPELATALLLALISFLLSRVKMRKK